jgi:L-rhamnose mutarotase
MSVHAGRQQEYVRRHQPIWPELEEMLLGHGVRTYSIFLDPATNDLFAYVEFATEAQWVAIAETEVCRRWWSHMSDLMPSQRDNSPVTAPLDEVFHIERR